MSEEFTMVCPRDPHIVNAESYEKELMNAYVDFEEHPELLTIKKLITLSEKIRDISKRIEHSYHKSYDDFTPIRYREYTELKSLRNDIGNYYFFKLVELQKEQK